MSSAPWLLFGFFTQAAFAITASILFLFLGGTLVPLQPPSTRAWAIDLVLALQFGILHSTLLLPAVRRRLTRVIPGPLYGCFFCAMTCVSVLLTIVFWTPFGPAIWNYRNVPLAYLPYLASWVALLLSIWVSGAGYQTGWTPFWAWLRGRELPPRELPERGLYRCLRHPIYLSFLCILWTPVLLSLDRVLLNTVWTVYTFVGSYLKDERLAYYLGERYREYQRRVPGYPFVPFGPLARLH